MLSSVVAFLIKLGFGGIVDKALGHLERRAELENDKERLRTMTTIALAQEAVKETKVMADFNKAKLQIPWFWVMVFPFVLSLAVYFMANTFYNLLWCADCIYPQTWTIAAYPYPLDEWAGRMIAWLFFIGTGVAAFKKTWRN